MSILDFTDPATWDPALVDAAEALARGELVVLPTDTVYGVGADAFQPEAVARLLGAKGRGRQMPPPVLVASVEAVDALAVDLPDPARELMDQFWPGALTLVCTAQPTLSWDLGDTGGTVALRRPNHPGALALLHRTGPLAVSSANLTGHRAARTATEAEEQLGESVGVYLDGGRATQVIPSTIVDVTGEIPVVLRMGAIDLEQLREVVPEISEGD